MSARMNIVCLMIFVVVAAASALKSEFQPSKTIRISKFQGFCPGNEKAPIILRDIELTPVGKLSYISLKVVIKQDVLNPLKMILKLRKCKSSEDQSASCMKEKILNVGHMCDLMAADNKIWTPFVKLSQPPMTSCPSRKGVYVIKNGTLDGSGLVQIPVLGWYWIVNVNLIEEASERVIMCILVEGEVINNRN